MLKTKLANWPAPKNISALSTTRLFNNLALHVGDDEQQVLQNRQALRQYLDLPSEPFWLNQTHSTTCVLADKEAQTNADAAISRSKQHPLVILTADCLPITLCTLQGNEIAAIHAGWKGLCEGVIESTLDKMESPAEDLLAWIGPSICQSCYEIGEEVYRAFTNKHPSSAAAFQAKNKKYLANLAKIAEIILYSRGVKAVYQSDLCTFELEEEFYSYRREGQTGRIATLIWFNKQNPGFVS